MSCYGISCCPNIVMLLFTMNFVNASSETYDLSSKTKQCQLAWTRIRVSLDRSVDRNDKTAKNGGGQALSACFPEAKYCCSSFAFFPQSPTQFIDAEYIQCSMSCCSVGGAGPSWLTGLYFRAMTLDDVNSAAILSRIDELSSEASFAAQLICESINRNAIANTLGALPVFIVIISIAARCASEAAKRN